ncbi:TnsA endonuclease N-terminal domain-containing protein [Paenibacillus abyssi]|uniref:TnsA endonuclease N-terminal domain-containing protein n=1 Tax=Paenibacillus abyssi TaxID=1340531 RepID=A0A917D2C7_9BACL|nr:TnsA endonuclease N-terminal domain-containing protein [Paenibacillus abyssi]GGG05428.1 hypothetical protein GCM10010916_23120 [Paenibacillus abyssi]
MTIKQKIDLALEERRKLYMHYNDKDRIVEPAYLFSVEKASYMVAYCYFRKEWRTFRISRIEICRVLDESSERPITPWAQVDLSSLNRRNIKLIRSVTSKLTATQYANSTGDISKTSTHVKATNESTTYTSPNYIKRDSNYPKTLESIKHDGPIICRSPLEERVYRSIIRDKEVEFFQVEPLKIPYEFENKTRMYIPDALIKYKSGDTYIIEVKLSDEIHTPVNQAKFRAAEKYAKEKGYNFSIKGIYTSASGYSLLGNMDGMKKTKPQRLKLLILLMKSRHLMAHNSQTKNQTSKLQITHGYG